MFFAEFWRSSSWRIAFNALIFVHFWFRLFCFLHYSHVHVAQASAVQLMKKSMAPQPMAQWICYSKGRLIDLHWITLIVDTCPYDSFYVNRLKLNEILAASDRKGSEGPWNPQFKVEKKFWLVLPKILKQVEYESARRMNICFLLIAFLRYT